MWLIFTTHTRDIKGLVDGKKYSQWQGFHEPRKNFSDMNKSWFIYVFIRYDNFQQPYEADHLHHMHIIMFSSLKDTAVIDIKFYMLVLFQNTWRRSPGCIWPVTFPLLLCTQMNYRRISFLRFHLLHFWQSLMVSQRRSIKLTKTLSWRDSRSPDYLTLSSFSSRWERLVF